MSDGRTKPTLRELRERRALSLSELARAAGVHADTVWQIETGRRVPYPRTRRELAAALGVDPSDISWPERSRRPTTTCGYCGAVVSPDEAAAHLATHLGETLIVVDAANMTPRLVRHVPRGDGRVEVESADPQPPRHMLLAAIRRAGGALNISGIYPVTPALERWVARRAPRWRPAQ